MTDKRIEIVNNIENERVCLDKLDKLFEFNLKEIIKCNSIDGVNKLLKQNALAYLITNISEISDNFEKINRYTFNNEFGFCEIYMNCGIVYKYFQAITRKILLIDYYKSLSDKDQRIIWFEYINNNEYTKSLSEFIIDLLNSNLKTDKLFKILENKGYCLLDVSRLGFWILINKEN